MYCKKCGNQLPDSAKFCSKCGTPVQMPANITQDQQDMPHQQLGAELGADSKKKRKKLLTAIAVLVVLVLVAGIGSGVYFAVFHKPAESTSEEEYLLVANSSDDQGSAEQSNTSLQSNLETLKPSGSSLEQEAEVPLDAEAVDSQKDVASNESADESLDEESENPYVLVSVVSASSLYGPGIERREEYTYDIKGQILTQKDYYDGASQGSIEYKYNEDGTVNQEIHYDEDGLSQGPIEYEYNEDGTVYQEIHYDENGILDWWYENHYDSVGRLIRKTHELYRIGPDYWYEYSYDEFGNMLSESYYETPDGLSRRTEYTYDDMGNKLGEIYYDSNFVVSSRWEYAYDEAGNMLKEAYYNASGNLEQQDEYDYDLDGNILKRIRTDSNGCQYWNEYTYDEQGNELTERDYNYDGSIIHDYRFEYTFDNAGRLLEQVVYESGRVHSKMTYQYDEYGNLLYEDWTGDAEEGHKEYTYALLTEVAQAN